MKNIWVFQRWWEEKKGKFELHQGEDLGQVTGMEGKTFVTSGKGSPT